MVVSCLEERTGVDAATLRVVSAASNHPANGALTGVELLRPNGEGRR
jgi:hypothetical protein